MWSTGGIIPRFRSSRTGRESHVLPQRAKTKENQGKRALVNTSNALFLISAGVHITFSEAPIKRYDIPLALRLHGRSSKPPFGSASVVVAWIYMVQLLLVCVCRFRSPHPVEEVSFLGETLVCLWGRYS